MTILARPAPGSSGLPRVSQDRTVPGQSRITVAPRPKSHHGPSCRIEPHLEQGGAATRHRVRRSPRRALPWKARPARPRRPQPVGAADLPRIFVTACGTTAPPSSSLSIVQLPAAASQGAWGVAARSACADPGPGAHSPGVRAYEEDGMEQSNGIFPDLVIHDRPGQRLSAQSRAVPLV